MICSSNVSFHACEIVLLVALKFERQKFRHLFKIHSEFGY